MTALRAFVLMPFDDEFNGIYDGLIEPPLSSAGYVVGRADATLDQQNIMRDIVHGINGADLVIADLTGLNGNVMYELGLAHGLGRPTVLLAQSISEVPFDLRSYRVQEYSTHFQDAEQLRQALSAIAREHAAGQLVFGSPVSDFTGVGTTFPTSASLDVASEHPDIAPAETETGFLDALQAYEEASVVFNTSFGTLAAETAAVGGDIAEMTNRIEQLTSADPGPTTARQYRNIAIKAAAVLDRYSNRLEETLPETEEASATILDSGLVYVTHMRVNGTAEQVAELRSSSESLVDAVRPAMEGVSEFRESILGLRGISAPLTAAARRAGRNIDRVISVGERMESFAERSLLLLEEDEPEGGQ